jgi:flagellar biogenesis protein FliO
MLDEGPSSSKTNPSLTLGKVDAETTPEMSVVNIRLNSKPTWKTVSVKEHGSYLQVDLPGTIIPQSGTFYDGSGPHIKKIGSFQMGERDGAIRIFTAGDNTVIAKATTAEVLEDRVIVTVDHSKLIAASASAREDKGPSTPASSLSADQVIAGTQVTPDTSPSDFLKKQTPLVIGSNAPDFRGRFLAVGLFSTFMLMSLLGVWLLKPYFARRGRGRGKPAPEAAMRMLATLPLSAKQKLALIQVGQEQILVAVGPESTNLITTLKTSAIAPRPDFTKMLEEADASDQSPTRASLVEMKPALGLPAAASAPRAPISRTPQKVFDDADMPADENAGSIKGMLSASNTKKKSGRLNIAVGDDGIREIPAATAPRAGSEKAIKDLTRQIRDRLKEIRPS